MTEVSKHPKHEGRPAHPRYGLPLSGSPRTFAGVTFRPYKRGILLYITVSDDFRIELYTTTNRNSWTAVVDGEPLPTRFRSETNAAEAAVKLVQKKAVSVG
jgi:hypothetical protein